MTRPQHQKVVLAPTAIGIGAVLALSGCSAGQTTQTSTQVAAVNGADASVDDIAIRDAQFPFPRQQPYYPAGSSVPIELVLSNEGSTADRLVQVSSPYAGSAQVGGFSTIPAQGALHAEDSSSDSRPGVEGSPSDHREVQITLQDLKQEIGPGVTVPVTFVFEKAGPTTAQVPIGADNSPRSEHGSPAPNGNSSGSEH